MTTSLYRALCSLALIFILPLPTPTKAAPALAAPEVAPETVKLRAKVSDAANQPIEGATVAVVRNAVEGAVYDEEKRTTALTTDAQGRFEIQVPRAKYPVQAFVYAPGYALQRADLKPDDDNQITLKLGAPATGKVVDTEGNPVAGARVEITRLFLASADTNSQITRYVSLYALSGSALKGVLKSQTDADGIWEIADMPIGSEGVFRLDDPRFAQDEKTSVPHADRQIAPDLTAEPGATLKGRVTAPDGKPVAKAKITASVTRQNNSRASTLTAPDGTYLLTSLRAGAAEIQVGSPDPDLAPTSIAGVIAEAGKTNIVPEVRLDAGVVMKGKVLYVESGAPVVGAGVSAWGDFGSVSGGVTGADGIYSLRVPTGKVRFYLYSLPLGYVRDRFDATNFDITEAITSAPDLGIARGLILVGTARDESGAPVTNVTIESGSLFDSAQTTVDSAGNWKLIGVDPKTNRFARTGGKVELVVRGDWQIVGDPLFDPHEGTPIALTLRRIERQDVTIRVVTPTGEPVADAIVRIASSLNSRNSVTSYDNFITDASGEVTVKRLRAGVSVDITATKSGYKLKEAGFITVYADNTKRATDAILAPIN